MPKSFLRQFVDLISDAVDSIEETYGAAGVQFPTLDSPFDPSHTSQALLINPDVAKQAAIIVGAAEQLSVSVRPAQNVLFETVMMFHKSTSLGAVSVGSVAEILREAGPEGLHVRDISAKNKMDATKLSRLLRLLATHSIFKEVEPNVFTNNRISSALDTMSPTSELFSEEFNDPWFHSHDKYLGSNGVAALVEHTSEDIYKSSAYMVDNLFSPDTRSSDEPTTMPFNRAFKTDITLFDWFRLPGKVHERRGIRFGYAMKGVGNPGEILADGGYPWGSLPAGAKIVDVGGGIGSVSLPIAKTFSELKVVVQDSPQTVSQAASFWEEHLPGSVKSGQVSFQAHNFFEPQPIKDADIWLLRLIMHDWPNAYAIKILKHLREASVPGKTKLLIVDTVADYACEGTVFGAREIPGGTHPTAPKPLLPNFGRGSAMTHLLDLQMLCGHQGLERTIGDHIAVIEASGWKTTQLYTPVASFHRHILAEAV